MNPNIDISAMQLYSWPFLITVLVPIVSSFALCPTTLSFVPQRCIVPPVVNWSSLSKGLNDDKGRRQRPPFLSLAKKGDAISSMVRSKAVIAHDNPSSKKREQIVVEDNVDSHDVGDEEFYKKTSSSSKRRSWTSSATTITGKWRENYLELQEFQQKHGHTRVPYTYRLNPSLGRWVQRQRSLYNEMQYSSSKSKNGSAKNVRKMRPSTVLSEERIQALKDIGFSFESPRKRTWKKRFDDLCLYRALHGDCLVPLHYEDIPGLGVWVRNQRTQYRNLLLGRKKQSHLTPDKIAALQSIGFVWDTQRNDQWKRRFDELVDFKAVYGHCSVPEKYHENQQLGTWVANQRSSYKNFFAGNSGSLDNESQLMGTCTARGLTKEKIAALESIGFCWDQTTYNWYSMYERLKQYKKQKMEEEQASSDKGATKDGTNASPPSSSLSSSSSSSSTQEGDDLAPFFHVPPEDVANRDLRLWIAVQRKEYSNYMYNKNYPDGIKKRTSMTPRRKRALDAINFPWSANKQKYAAAGPTVDDWTKLFERMREKGIDKNAKPKEHWFEGESSFSSNNGWYWNKDQWTDDDLLKLWNMEDDE